MRRVPSRRSVTSPAPLRIFRCCETAGRLTGQLLGEAADRRGFLLERLEDGAPRRIGQRVEGFLVSHYLR